MIKVMKNQIKFFILAIEIKDGGVTRRNYSDGYCHNMKEVIVNSKKLNYYS